jgi:hypothetical protein
MGFFDEMQKTIFFQNDANSASAQAMRQKIALAMLMKKSTAPKTLGEGLYSIGDSLADAYGAKTLERQTAEQSAKTDAAISRLDSTATGTPSTATTGPRADVSPLLRDDGTETETDVNSPAQRSAAATGVSPAAAAGFRPAPAYLQPALAASGLPPERQAYLGHLAGREAQSPNEVSSTGAAGPFQFTRGTGAQYGIPGNARFDINRSITAANQLTDDNAAVLEQGLGRPPTPGELALAHQQGAGTAVKMLTGAGNAPARNLAVNNAGGLGGQDAAQKIMAYYNMPGGGPRDRTAAILASRGEQPPTAAATPPTAADTAQEARLSDVTGMQRPAATPAFAPTASLAGRTGDVQSDMPPVTGALQGALGASVADTVQQRQGTFGAQPAPPVPPPGGNPQVAQAAPSVFPPVTTDAGGRPAAIIPGGGLPPAPAAIPAAPPDPRSVVRTAPRLPDEYVPPEKDPQPEPPAKPGMGPIEQRMIRDYLNKDVDPRIKEAATRQIEAERQRLAIPYENDVLKYKADIANWQKRQEQTLGYKMGLPKQRAETEREYATTGKTLAETPKAQAEADTAVLTNKFYQRTGREREPFLKEFASEKEQITKVAPMLRDVAIAKEALDTGAVASGFGADAKFNAARIAAKIGSQDAQKIANESEKYQKAMDRTISYGIMLVNGKDPRVSEGDVAQAKGLQGTPDMQEASKRRIIAVMQEDLHNKVGNYEDIREKYLRDDPQHRFFKVDTPQIGTPELRKVLIDHQNRPDVIAEFDRLNGPGAAKLELARHKRRMERPDD